MTSSGASWISSATGCSPAKPASATSSSSESWTSSSSGAGRSCPDEAQGKAKTRATLAPRTILMPPRGGEQPRGALNYNAPVKSVSLWSDLGGWFRSFAFLFQPGHFLRQLFDALEQSGSCERQVPSDTNEAKCAQGRVVPAKVSGRARRQASPHFANYEPSGSPADQRTREVEPSLVP